MGTSGSTNPLSIEGTFNRLIISLLRLPVFFPCEAVKSLDLLMS
jgi:hypothetical protein